MLLDRTTDSKSNFSKEDIIHTSVYNLTTRTSTWHVQRFSQHLHNPKYFATIQQLLIQQNVPLSTFYLLKIYLFKELKQQIKPRTLEGGGSAKSVPESESEDPEI